MSARRFPTRLSLFGLLVVGLLLLVDPLPSQEKDAAREKQIAEIKKRIEELNRKLDDLQRSEQKKVDTTPVPPGTFNPGWLKALTWRSIGPATMGGRITALAVHEADPNIFYVGTATGGLLKTTSNGVTFQHQFTKQNTVSIGDVCVAPSNPNIVWVGAGENNPRNSVSYGDGVYKSTDGGKTWKHMGLKKSFQIGKIIIHPEDPNIVYVGAMGRLYGPSEERGLYKTTDGGNSWEKILYINDLTGIVDMRMHPKDANTLIVAAWEHKRDAFDSHVGSTPPEGYDSYDPMLKWGAGSGIFKTTNGGKSFVRITQGLPTGKMGRIGLDYYRKDPNIVYAVIDCENIAKAPKNVVAGNAYMGINGQDGDKGAKLIQVVNNSPAAKAGLKAGDVIVAVGKKKIAEYQDLIEEIRNRKAGDKMPLKVIRDKETVDINLVLGKRQGRPTNRRRPFSSGLGGQRENIQARQGKDGFEYGGVYKSTDGGDSWERVNSLNPRPMYFSQIRVDPTNDKNVYVLGISLHRSSDGGKRFRGDGGRGVHPDHHAMWIDPRDSRHVILGTDGGVYVSHDRMGSWDFHNHMALGQFYHVAVDNRRPYRVYGGLQDNGSWGGPSLSLQYPGIVNNDWFVIGGGDGFVCRVDPTNPDLVYGESQNGAMFRRNLRTGQFARIRPAQQKGAPRYRFNWNTPFILSNHNPSIFYCAANYVFRSVKQGDDLRVISPEITRTKRGTGTAVAESPRNPDVIYAGTDDGYVWVTLDGGKKWTNITPPMAKAGDANGKPGDYLPGPRWVATIEPSRYADGRAYVAFDAHRSDDDEPYVFVTEDYGKSWKSIRGNLPWGSTRVLREDVKNPNLLFVGTEIAVWASLDRGKSWHKINNNLPTVPVHELAIHPTAGEMVAATHGRSLWVLDISPLQQLTGAVVKAPAHLYRPSNAVRWARQPSRRPSGHRNFVGQNPPRGAVLYYSLAGKPKKFSLSVVDIAGKTIHRLKAKSDPGLHKVVWNLTRPGQRRPGQRRGRPPTVAVPPGLYRLVLIADDIEVSQPLRVEQDPNVPDAVVTVEEEEEEEGQVPPLID